MKSLTILLLGLVLFVGLARPAPAQTPGLEVTVTVLGEARHAAGAPSEHLLTFSAPVGIPGVGLAPGAYIFRLLTPSVMQVLNEDRSMVYGMFFVTPTRRTEATDEYQRDTSENPARSASARGDVVRSRLVLGL